MKIEIELTSREQEVAYNYCLLRTYELAVECLEQIDTEKGGALTDKVQTVLDDLCDTSRVVESIRGKIVEALRVSTTNS